MSGSADDALLESYRFWLATGNNILLAALFAEMLVMWAFSFFSSPTRRETAEITLTLFCTMGILIDAWDREVYHGSAFLT